MIANRDTSHVRLTINGREVDVDPTAHSNLLAFLRNELRLTGTKIGCASGNCGACSVLVDGIAVQSCQVGPGAVAGTDIKTIESVVQTSLGNQIADTLARHDAAQCGYCLPGIVVAAYGGFVNVENPDPVAVLERNLCRCGTHHRILKALREVIDTRESPT